MKIEKVSKYIVSHSPSRSSSEQSTVRKVLLSLPRVRWLERDNPKPESSSEDVIDAGGNHDYVILTKREKEIYALHKEGTTDKQISGMKKISITMVRKTIHSAIKKLASRNRAVEYTGAEAGAPGVDEN